jgi:UDP-2,4-diacetamido-2,4,6-trideoxy-beta-L-altropyranose hydrolase
MNLFIRADANAHIGTGHIMRCLALAQACREHGGDVKFLSCCDSYRLRQRIRSEGFTLIPLERPHPNPTDLRQTVTLLQTLKNRKTAQWLILDGYQFGPDYQETIRESEINLLVIDDYNHQSYYQADILLNQNIGAERLQYACDSNTLLLLGTEYVLLRKEFLMKKDKIRNVPEIARKILLTLGGADPKNVMTMVIQALKLLDIKGLEAKIIIGPTNHHLKILNRELKSDRTEEHVFQMVQDANMPQLMSWADVAVTAGGSTCWELAFMGLPFLTIILADNQVRIACGLDEFGAALNVGWYRDLSYKKLASHLSTLISHHKFRMLMSKRGRQLVDGLGAKRVIDSLLET